MSDRDPLHDPRAGDTIHANGVTRTIIYTSAYGLVFYKNSAGVRKRTELNSYRKWAVDGEAQAGAHPGRNRLNAMISNDVLDEAEKILTHFADNFGHPTRDLMIETLLEFGIAVACGGVHSREKIYSALRRKMKI